MKYALGLVGAVVLLMFQATSFAAAKDMSYRTNFLGWAAEGYDVVAYFNAGKPTEGESEFRHDWSGVKWRFANATNQKLFASNPKKYAPQYGGFCAYAVSQGSTASVIPEAWHIVDGKLYLNYSKGVQAQWEKDIPGYISLADEKWPDIEAGL